MYHECPGYIGLYYINQLSQETLNRLMSD